MTNKSGGKRKRKPSQPAENIPSGEPLDESVQAVPLEKNGDGPDAPMVNLDAFLAEISTRLVTAGSITLPEQQPAPLPQERMQIIIFAMGSTHYAVEVDRIGEVVRSPELTPVPGLPDWVLGVANLHGDIISAVDLSLFLGISDHVTDQTAYMIVAQAGDQRIGLVVDDVDIIYTFPAEQVVSPPFKIAPELVPYLRGAVERRNDFIRFLDCERLLLGPQMQKFG
ncbi:MAG: purine-binding chemotaxis protein CheW [Anaerolineae bacterium]|nr:purine-binding chemotaxis protein CheW [Anaerolineae bacterium]